MMGHYPYLLRLWQYCAWYYFNIGICAVGVIDDFGDFQFIDLNQFRYSLSNRWIGEEFYYKELIQ